MFDALARLADRRARWMVIGAVVVFVAAGALGAGVADKLDPYGADDPETESVRADERIEAAGHRETGVRGELTASSRVAAPHHGIKRQWNQMRFRIVHLANLASRVGAGGVEIS